MIGVCSKYILEVFAAGCDVWITMSLKNIPVRPADWRKWKMPKMAEARRVTGPQTMGRGVGINDYR